MNRGIKTYVAYKGDEVAAIGTLEEVAEQLGVKPSTVKWRATPSGKARGKDLYIEVVEDE